MSRPKMLVKNFGSHPASARKKGTSCDPSSDLTDVTSLQLRYSSARYSRQLSYLQNRYHTFFTSHEPIREKSERQRRTLAPYLPTIRYVGITEVTTGGGGGAEIGFVGQGRYCVAIPQPVWHCTHGDAFGHTVVVVTVTETRSHPHGTTTASVAVNQYMKRKLVPQFRNTTHSPRCSQPGYRKGCRILKWQTKWPLLCSCRRWRHGLWLWGGPWLLSVWRQKGDRRG